MEFAADSADCAPGARCFANRIDSDKATSACQAASDRNNAPDNRDRIRERFRESASLQRRLQQSLWNAADTTAQDCERFIDLVASRDRHIHTATCISVAVRLGWDVTLSSHEGVCRCRVCRQQVVLANDSSWRTFGLGSRAQRPAEERASRRIGTRTDAGSACTSWQVAKPVRSQCQARYDIRSADARSRTRRYREIQYGDACAGMFRWV